MTRLLTILAMLLVALAPGLAAADPADIDAAARGVVRVLVVDTGGMDGEVVPVSHGTGFAVSATQVVTNNHVVDELREDDRLELRIVPPEGGEAVPARIRSLSPRNDLALIEVVDGLRLPPLTIAGAADMDSGEVSAVGYPQNVDIAQGLELGDVFRAQPPVKSRGFLSGRRPARRFDTILHTAPIARGNSGGPLLDTCGRVVGVNSFGAQSGGADAEFFFAISTRELLPFLRANDIQPRVNGMPCRSLADLDAAERQRLEARAQESEAQQRAAAAERRSAQARAARTAEREVLEERDNKLAMAAIALAMALVAGFAAWQFKVARRETPFRVAAGAAGVMLVAALAAWFTRPSLNEIDDRAAAMLAGVDNDDGTPAPPEMLAGDFVCTVDPARSRITGASTEDLPFSWAEGGCVNGRTQYGLSQGRWSRIFVPNEEAVVSINSYDPQAGEYRMERYLLGANDMAEARTARSQYRAPSCGSGEAAARTLGQQQRSIEALLPDQPNERVVYRCQPARE